MTAKLPNTEAFRRALKQGSGRAMILLRDDPRNEVYRAALLHACRVDLNYDRQCEFDRAPYLYRLIVATGQFDSIIAELSRSLFSNENFSGRAKVLPVVCTKT